MWRANEISIRKAVQERRSRDEGMVKDRISTFNIKLRSQLVFEHHGQQEI
jgi:hypothetical protein